MTITEVLYRTVPGAHGAQEVAPVLRSVTSNSYLVTHCSYPTLRLAFPTNPVTRRRVNKRNLVDRWGYLVIMVIGPFFSYHSSDGRSPIDSQHNTLGRLQPQA